MPYFLPPRLILALFTTLTSPVCFAFLIHTSWTNLPSSRLTSYVMKKDINNGVDGNSYKEQVKFQSSIVISDSNRRKFLSIFQAAPFLIHQQSASAQVAVLDAPVQQNNNRQASRMICADLEEENRIEVFERVAPSVVYIDTFAEKRDVFSTNV